MSLHFDKAFEPEDDVEWEGGPGIYDVLPTLLTLPFIVLVSAEMLLHGCTVWLHDFSYRDARRQVREYGTLKEVLDNQRRTRARARALKQR